MVPGFFEPFVPFTGGTVVVVVVDGVGTWAPITCCACVICLLHHVDVGLELDPGCSALSAASALV